MPISIESKAHLDKIFAESNDKLSIIDFTATWCGPCRLINPVFEALSKKHADVNFLKCDVDDRQDVAAFYGVSSMPTFLFFKGDTKVDMVRGPNKAALEEGIRKHSTSSGSFPGEGRVLGAPDMNVEF